MATISIFFCISALLVQMIAGQCISSANLNSASISNWITSGCGSAGQSAPIAAPAISVQPTNGGGFQVWSVSPLSPNGVSVASDNNIEGILSVTGQLPFLSAVALQGQVQSGGQAGVQYSCGDSNIGITNAGASNAAASGINSLSGAGWSQGGAAWGIGNSCGCGSY